MKTEKEKMLSGMAYNAFDSELLRERQRTKEMIFDFNTPAPQGNQKTQRNHQDPFRQNQQGLFYRTALPL